MRVLTYSYNLLGDSLQTTVALRAFYKEFSEKKESTPFSMTIATDDNYIAVIYKRMGIPVEVYTGDPKLLDEHSYDFVFDFNISKAFSLGIATNTPASIIFCTMLGVTPERAYPFYESLFLELPHGAGVVQPDLAILFQPYSVSCSSWSGHAANKRWPDECWAKVYEWLRKDYPQFLVVVLGGEKDYVIPGIPEECHLFNRTLDEVALYQKNARLILSLDSGVAHLAASQDARMIELYPIALPSQWMSNSESPNVRIIHALPWELSEDWVYTQCVNYLREIQLCLTTPRELFPSSAPTVAK